MIGFLTTVSIILAAAIVGVVAYHLVFIYLALKRAGDHLEALAGGLVRIRDDTEPLEPRIAAINGGLGVLVGPLLATNDNLAKIVAIATRH